MAVDVKDEEEAAAAAGAEEEANAVSSSSTSDDDDDSDNNSSDDDGERARTANEAAADAALNEARAAVLSNLVAPVQLSDEPPGEDEPVRFVFCSPYFGREKEDTKVKGDGV